MSHGGVSQPDRRGVGGGVGPRDLRDEGPGASRTRCSGPSPARPPADAARAVAAAAEAFPAWAATPAPARGAILFRAAELLDERLDDVARTLTREEGKTLAEAKGEVLRARDILRYFGGEGWRAGGDVLPANAPKAMLYSRREPLGVVAVITPWNFPIAIPAWKIAPALAYGNTVVFKPASATPLTALRLVECLQDAGLPAGVLNFVTGSGAHRRRRPRRRPRGARPHVHRVVRRRDRRLRARGAALRARPAGDGRQEPDDRAGRRRPGPGREARRHGRLRPDRPELHGHEPRHRGGGRRRPLRRGSGGGRRGAVRRRRPGGRCPDGPGGERAAAGDRPQLHRDRQERGRRAARRGRPRRRRRSLRAADRLRRRRRPQPPGAGGGLRTGDRASSAPATWTTRWSRRTPWATASRRASSPTICAAP